MPRKSVLSETERLERRRESSRRWQRQFRSKNPLFYRARRYGVFPSDIELLWDAQCGRCAGCRDILETGHQGFCVDHDHVTGRVRGLLCTPCNKGMGILRDDPQLLRRLADYLEGGGEVP